MTNTHTHTKYINVTLKKVMNTKHEINEAKSSGKLKKRCADDMSSWEKHVNGT